MTSSTRDKLHPALWLMLSALQVARQRGDRDVPLGQQAAFGARLLHGLLRVLAAIYRPRLGKEQKGPGPQLATTESTAAENVTALMPRLVAIAPLVARTEAQSEFVEIWPDLIERAEAEGKEGLRQTIKPTLTVATAIHESARPAARVFTAPMLDAMLSIRSNRSPQPAFRKLSHHTILTFLFLFGALKGTSSDLSESFLTLEEVGEVFDWCCPACNQCHSSEALKKAVQRFLRDTLKEWPADKMRRERSRQRSIEIRYRVS